MCSGRELHTTVWGLDEPAARWAAQQPAGIDVDAISTEVLIPTAGVESGLTAEDVQLLKNAATELMGADMDDVSMADYVEGEGGGGSFEEDWASAASGSDEDSDDMGETELKVEGTQWRLNEGYSGL